MPEKCTDCGFAPVVHEDDDQDWTCYRCSMQSYQYLLGKVHHKITVLTERSAELTAERDKYRDACERLIGHYGDEGSWRSGRGGTIRIYKTKSVTDKGYDFARQVKAEIEGK